MRYFIVLAKIYHYGPTLKITANDLDLFNNGRIISTSIDYCCYLFSLLFLNLFQRGWATLGRINDFIHTTGEILALMRKYISFPVEIVISRFLKRLSLYLFNYNKRKITEQKTNVLSAIM